MPNNRNSNNQHTQDNQQTPSGQEVYPAPLLVGTERSELLRGAPSEKEVRLEDLTPDMALPHNIFADMGLPNPEMRQAKALVSILFEKAMRGQVLTQRQAAERTGLTQPEVSKIVRGVCSGFTLDRLLSAMAALGQDVQISFQEAAQEQGVVRVGPAEIHAETASVLKVLTASLSAPDPPRTRRKAATRRPQKTNFEAGV